MQKIVIDPVTRIEGHLKVEVAVEAGKVQEARCAGTLFRGYEIILRGRHPLDAQRLTTRVCGVCPTAHALASAQALDAALGVADQIPANGRLARNLIAAGNYFQSHILHFYHLAALDFVDVTACADYAGTDPDLVSVRDFLQRGALGPFVPRYEVDFRLSAEANRELTKHYVEALRARKLAHEIVSVLGGKAPHNVGIVPGGVIGEPSPDRVAQLIGKVRQMQAFVENIYLPDVLAVAGAYGDYLEIGEGCGRFLAYGMFDLDGSSGHPAQRDRLFRQGVLNGKSQPDDVDFAKITEQVKHSWYAAGGHPSEEVTEPSPNKDGAYSWVKSPRYDGQPHEVGPLARLRVNYARGNEKVKAAVDGVASAAGIQANALQAVLGRHAGRAIECQLLCHQMLDWLQQIEPGEPYCVPALIPAEGAGTGFVDAPRGALLHHIQIKGHRIDRYQLVVPTTWNASPKDDRDQPGPIEQALLGTKVKDTENPVEVVRIIRSFDPCLACAVHLVDARGNEKGCYPIA